MNQEKSNFPSQNHFHTRKSMKKLILASAKFTFTYSKPYPQIICQATESSLVTEANDDGMDDVECVSRRQSSQLNDYYQIHAFKISPHIPPNCQCYVSNFHFRCSYLTLLILIWNESDAYSSSTLSPSIHPASNRQNCRSCVSLVKSLSRWCWWRWGWYWWELCRFSGRI